MIIFTAITIAIATAGVVALLRMLHKSRLRPSMNLDQLTSAMAALGLNFGVVLRPQLEQALQAFKEAAAWSIKSRPMT